MKNNLLQPLLLSAIEEAIRSQKRNVWKEKESIFSRIRDAELDSRGSAGEKFVADVLRELEHNVSHTAATDPQNKQWDLVVDDKHRWEVKTATLGGSGKTFQHENIHRDRAYHGIVFLDIAPDDLYVSFIAKHSIPWNKLHRRKDSTFYKWDFNLSRLGKPTKTVEEFGISYDEAVAIIEEFLAGQKNPHEI